MPERMWGKLRFPPTLLVRMQVGTATVENSMEVPQKIKTGWGTHVNPWLIHVNLWQKPLQYCKVISLQLIKIKEKINK